MEIKLIAYYLMTVVLLLGMAYSQPWMRFGTQNCIKGCFHKYPSAFFCTHSREHGFCCPDTSRSECRESANIKCSQGANNHEFAKYAYCPRRTA